MCAVPVDEGQWVLARLVAAGCVAAEEEAAELLAAATDVEQLEGWLRRREHGEPLAWIIGSAPFCGHLVGVDQGVYVPRHQSAELAVRAAAHLASVAGRAVDLCTGSGAVAVHLKHAAPAASVIGVDLDASAVACARRNGVEVLRGDLGEALRPGAFDVVTAVAPYVPTDALSLLPRDVQEFEPRLALDGGVDGLALLRRVVASAASLLRDGGWLLVELGGDQDALLAPELARHGFTSSTSWFDEDGELRGLEATREAPRR